MISSQYAALYNHLSIVPILYIALYLTRNLRLSALIETFPEFTVI